MYITNNTETDGIINQVPTIVFGDADLITGFAKDNDGEFATGIFIAIPLRPLKGKLGDIVPPNTIPLKPVINIMFRTPDDVLAMIDTLNCIINNFVAGKETTQSNEQHS